LSAGFLCYSNAYYGHEKLIRAVGQLLFPEGETGYIVTIENFCNGEAHFRYEQVKGLCMDEQAIIKQVQCGDVEAYEQLMDLHVRRLRSFIALRAPVPHLIDEIAHESFVYAFRNIHQFRAGGNFSAWLMAIAVNLMRSEKQRHSREVANRENYFERHVLSLAQDCEPHRDMCLLDHLTTCIEQLPPHLRELIQLRSQLTCNTLEIAKQLGRSAAWVGTMLFRVRSQLKTCMDNHLAAEKP
jgi:RNA polymerase sigma-70 factor (ECF subfamily)